MFDKIFAIGGYSFKNYTILDDTEKKLVLKHRNKNKKWMLNQDEISLESHLEWIDSLQTDRTKLYFLVFKDETPFISISYHDIKDDEAYWGYFLIDEEYKSEVLKIEKIIIDFAFDRLKVEKLLCINNLENHVIQIHKFFGFKAMEEKIVEDIKYLVMQLNRGERR
jgi:UDP-4-amino-4,6-dideoxy-N-acetyl-beta-L-altrosamine N-acetyltransferase